MNLSTTRFNALAYAAAYWRENALYHSGNAYRWSRHNPIPSWAIPGRIATPYSKAVVDVFPDCNEFHNYATSPEAIQRGATLHLHKHDWR